MTIIVESISKSQNQFEHVLEEDYPYYRGDCFNSYYNSVRCRIDNYINDDKYTFPKESIWLNDVIGFSNSMIKHEKYDCILEVESFLKVDLYTDNTYSIRGQWWSKVPKKYLPRYAIFKDQECIELYNNIILISPFNKTLSRTCSEGSMIEIIIQNSINLKSAHLSKQ